MPVLGTKPDPNLANMPQSELRTYLRETVVGQAQEFYRTMPEQQLPPLLIGVGPDGTSYLFNADNFLAADEGKELLSLAMQRITEQLHLRVVVFAVEAWSVEGLREDDPAAKKLLRGELQVHDMPNRIDVVSVLVQDAGTIEVQVYKRQGTALEELANSNTAHYYDSRFQFFPPQEADIKA